MVKEIKKQNKQKSEPIIENKQESNAALIHEYTDLEAEEIQKLLQESPTVVKSILAKLKITKLRFRSPMPSPADLEKYEQILPGFAERTLKMAEKTLENE